MHNTRAAPIVYEVTATGLDTGHRPFHYEFQILTAGGYTHLVTQILAEVEERCRRDNALRLTMATAAGAR